MRCDLNVRVLLTLSNHTSLAQTTYTICDTFMAWHSFAVKQRDNTQSWHSLCRSKVIKENLILNCNVCVRSIRHCLTRVYDLHLSQTITVNWMKTCYRWQWNSTLNLLIFSPIYAENISHQSETRSVPLIHLLTKHKRSSVKRSENDIRDCSTHIRNYHIDDLSRWVTACSRLMIVILLYS